MSVAGTIAAGVAGRQLRLRESADGLASAFPPLLVKAQRIAASLSLGLHGRRRSGAGEDFWQYRQYVPGDPAQLIDWRKSARVERTLIRQNEWAASNTLYLWASQGPGMDFQSGLSTTQKRERAALLAMVLAVMAVRAGERIAVIGAPHSPDHTNRTLMRVANWLSREDAAHAGDLPPAVELSRFSSCVLIGDFLSPLEETAHLLGKLAGGGLAGHVVQVLDPAEETFPYAGRTEFREVSGSDKYIAGKAEQLREGYRGKLAEHRAGLVELTRRLGWSFCVHHTDRAPQTVLLPLYGVISGDARVHGGVRAMNG